MHLFTLFNNSSYVKLNGLSHHYAKIHIQETFFKNEVSSRPCNSDYSIKAMGVIMEVDIVVHCDLHYT